MRYRRHHQQLEVAKPPGQMDPSSSFHTRPRSRVAAPRSRATGDIIVINGLGDRTRALIEDLIGIRAKRWVSAVSSSTQQCVMRTASPSAGCRCSPALSRLDPTSAAPAGCITSRNRRSRRTPG